MITWTLLAGIGFVFLAGGLTVVLSVRCVDSVSPSLESEEGLTDVTHN